MHWLHDQLYHFNIFMVIVVISITTILARMNLTKEVKMLTDDFYKNGEEIKDEIRERK